MIFIILLIVLGAFPMYMLIRNELVYVHQTVIGEIVFVYNNMLLDINHKHNLECIENNEPTDDEYSFLRKHEITHEDMTEEYATMFWKFWVFDLTKFRKSIPEHVHLETMRNAAEQVCLTE